MLRGETEKEEVSLHGLRLDCTKENRIPPQKDGKVQIPLGESDTASMCSAPLRITEHGLQEGLPGHRHKTHVFATWCAPKIQKSRSYVRMQTRPLRYRAELPVLHVGTGASCHC